MKKLLYFMVASSFLAARVFTVGLGAYRLSPFRAAVLAAPLALVFYAVYTRKPVRLIPDGASGFSIRFLIIWLLYALFSFFWCRDTAAWLQAVYFLGSGLTCWICFSAFFREKKDFAVCFWLMQAMVLLHNIIGWYEIVTRSYHFVTIDDRERFLRLRSGMPISMMNNPNDFALLMLFGIFLCGICFCGARSLPARFLPAATAASSAVLLAWTQSRANLLGLCLGAFAFFCLSGKSEKKRILAVSAALLIAALFLLPSYAGALDAYRDALVNAGSAKSDRVRINLLLNGLSFLVRTFGFGIGAGNIEYWMTHNAVYQTWGTADIHNWWMELLAGYGVPVFLLYCVFYVRLFRSFYAALRSSGDPWVRKVCRGLLCCMAGFLAGSLSSSSDIVREWLWVFWGVVVAFQGFVSGVPETAGSLPRSACAVQSE